MTAGLGAVPHHPALQRALVRLRYRSSGLAAALETAATLRREPANLPTAALLRGDVLRAAGKAANALDASEGPIAAVQVLRPWLARHQDDVAALEALARMYALSGQYGLEVGVLERMLSLLPNDPVVMNNLA